MTNKNLVTFSIIFSMFFIFLGPAVDAYVPVTYICCKNFSNGGGDKLDGFEHINEISGNQLDNFENLSNWAIGTGTQYADTINYKEGNQSLGLISPISNRVISDRVIKNNFSNGSYFSTWIYVYNASNFSYPRIYLTSTGNIWSRYLYGSYYSGLYNGWNKLLLNTNSFLSYNNESWNNSMNRIRIAMYPKNNLSTNVAIDDLRYNANNEWIAGGTGALQESDTVNFKEGSEGLKLIATNGYRAYSEKTINSDFSKTNNFVIWLYVENASSFDFLRIYMTSTGDSWSKYLQGNIYRPGAGSTGYKTGWNKLVFDKNSFTSFYNESWDNTMNRIRIAIYPMSGQNTSATVDDLRADMNGKRGKIIITFDDGDKNVFVKAAPVLKTNNQSAVSFVITSAIGNSGYMNISDLKNIQSDGWDISSHSVGHHYLTDLDMTNLSEELNNSYDWLVNNNFQKSAGFVAYPYGAFNDNVINYVKKRYIFGRSTSQQPIQQHFDASDEAELYIQKVTYVLNNTPVQSVKNSIDEIINSKLLGILLFHDMSDSNSGNDPYTYLISDFQNISDYLKSRSSDVDVVTYSDYVIPNIRDFTPVINKVTRIYSNGSSVLITKNKYDEYMPNMTVRPLSGSIDIVITSYNESGGSIKFNESSSSNVSYDIGDRTPNHTYNVKIYWANGTQYQDFNVLSDNNGHINYDYEGFGSPRYQEIDKTDNMSYSLSIISSLPVGDPTTTIGIPQTFEIYLNKTANVIWYINGSVVKTDPGVTSAIYSNSTASVGTYNVTTIVEDGIDSISKIWTWDVLPVVQERYNLSGYVNNNYGTGLDGVLVKNSSNQGLTDNSGYYTITGLLDGMYNFSYSKTGFNIGYLDVTINGSDKMASVILNPVPVARILNVTIFPANTTIYSTINVSVNISNNIGIIEVKANDTQLTQNSELWIGSIISSSSIGNYLLNITAKDVLGNNYQTSVPYKVVNSQGGASVSIIPRTNNVTTGNTVTPIIKVKNTQNIDDRFRAYISIDGIPAVYQSNLSWFDWTEKFLDIRAGKELNIPITISVPSGISGTKMFRARINSTTSSRVYTYDTGYLVIK